jgi:predicted alpha/beta superfamily hydrolase
MKTTVTDRWVIITSLVVHLVWQGCRPSTDQKPSVDRAHTARASVQAVADFPAAELSGPDSVVSTRRIWIYTPVSYAATSDRRYPVLYLFDGQNVFDDATSFVGEWGVDETLDSLKLDVIVVAVDHGNARRSKEYTPYSHPEDKDPDLKKRQTGAGAQTVDWLLKRVKPYVDSSYRTTTTSFVGGASLGGLMALYAHISHPTSFKAALDFSPAYWINDGDIFAFGRKAPITTRVYQLAGYREGPKQEWGSMVNGMKRMDDSLAVAGVPANQRTAIVDSLGEHNEAFWRRHFADGVRWLLAQ